MSRADKRAMAQPNNRAVGGSRITVTGGDKTGMRGPCSRAVSTISRTTPGVHETFHSLTHQISTHNIVSLAREELSTTERESMAAKKKTAKAKKPAAKKTTAKKKTTSK